MPSSSEKDKDNRTRIRDNQRRSRARRKEYLEELEQRVRQAELRGTHASIEVQAAARQVAEENKKLRLLLQHHGVSDKSIEAYLSSGTITPRGATGAGTLPAPRNISSAQRLERLPEPQTLPPINSVIASSSEPTRTCGNSTMSTSPLSTRPPSPNQNNCSMAADLISTMTGVNPHEVRTSLGCAPGTDCHVDNARIGDTIERFTETAGVVT